MSLLETAGQLSKIFRNVSRAREILRAMSRFGFDSLVQRIGFRSEAQGEDKKSRYEPMPVRLRLLIEELGPTFIKIGQTLSERPDLIPQDVVLELQKLQDQVAPLPFLEIKPIVEGDLNRPISECFSSFDIEPLATASIAQVHAARTLEGEDVVVKIKKPEVDRLLKQDLEILETIATLIEKVPELKPFRPLTIVKEFKRALLQETDLEREASNIKRFRQNFAESKFLVIPKVYADLSGPRVLCMERFRGVKLQDVDSLRKLGLDPREVLQQGLNIFLESILVHGLFHGDPHGGNIIVLPDGRIGLIDFGSVGWLSNRSKGALINMFLALISEDYEALVNEYVSLSPPVEERRDATSLETLEREVSQVFTPFHGLPLKEVPAAELLFQATQIAFKHQITLPPDLVLVFRSNMILEGIGRSLDPDFDLLGSASKFAKIALKERYKPEELIKELFYASREWYQLLRYFPRRTKELIRQAEAGQLRFQHKIPQLDELKKSQEQNSKRLALSFVTAAYVLSASLVIAFAHVPEWASIALLGFSGLLSAAVLYKSIR